MKILKLRFKNLNSLAGNWEIDFTHPDFVSSGIFAITGPTGAGKSTILDAICLALYGSTPRLDKISKNENEIMSRGTGECFAEIEFETQRGSYRCRWEQQRARRQRAGKIQDAHHEIAEISTGKILAEKLRETPAKVENVTGMDFRRFTRSMMLAQGDFAAFLQANAEERGNILEQITGTEIYSEISKEAYRKFSAEQQALEKLKEELAGIQLFSIEEEKTIRDVLTENEKLEKDFDGQIKEKTLAIAHQDAIVALEKEALEIAENSCRLDELEKTRAPDLVRYEAARKALELDAEFASLSSLRKEQMKDNALRIECLEKISSLADVEKAAGARFKLSSVNLEKSKNAQKNGMELTRKTRELDTRLKEQEAPFKALKSQAVKIESEIKTLQDKNGEAEKELAKAKAKIESVKEYLEKNKADQGLTESLTGIKERFSALRIAAGRRGEKVGELAKSKKAQTKAEKDLDNRKKLAEQAKKVFTKAAEAASELKKELEEKLQGNRMKFWRDKQLDLKDNKNLLERMSESLEEIDKAEKKLAEIIPAREKLEENKKSFTDLSAEIKIAHESLKCEISSLEENFALQAKIKSLEAERRSLKDGELCPLCGSIEHPFAQGNIPVLNEARQTLTSARKKLEKTSARLEEINIKIAGTGKDIEQLQQSRDERTKQKAAAKARFDESFVTLKIRMKDETLQVMTARLLKECSTELKKIAELIAEAEKIENALTAAEKIFSDAQTSMLNDESAVRNAILKKETADAETDRLKTELQNLDETGKISKNAALLLLAPFGITDLPDEKLDDIINSLTLRRSQWQEKQNLCETLSKKKSELEITISHHTEQTVKLETALKEKCTDTDSLARSIASLKNERKEFLGDKEPDKEDARFASECETSEKALESARKVFEEAGQNLSENQKRIIELGSALAQREPGMKAAEEAFKANFTSKGFTDEADYQRQRLEENVRLELASILESMAKERAALTARRQDNITRFETERGKKFTDQPREILEQESLAIAEKLKILRDGNFGSRQKLKNNEELRLKQKDKFDKIEVQTKFFEIWSKLNELIGAADGKKFKIFAQGLTFELLVNRANPQLKRMTDRYLLIRDKRAPLELQIIDNCHAGEIRSIKNLSGGESFLVSLALALGLSCMSSRNVRIDSLFLDEGFGSLDEETLNTALTALGELNQENKMIGIISHVPALKERIGAQIQIIPLAGGKSRILGPGCSSLER